MCARAIYLNVSVHARTVCELGTQSHACARVCIAFNNLCRVFVVYTIRCVSILCFLLFAYDDLYFVRCSCLAYLVLSFWVIQNHLRLWLLISHIIIYTRRMNTIYSGIRNVNWPRLFLDQMDGRRSIATTNTVQEDNNSNNNKKNVNAIRERYTIKEYHHRDSNNNNTNGSINICGEVYLTLQNWI